MNNGLLFLGGLLVAIFAALFAVPTFIDWNSYRGVFEEEASKVLGRDVRVGGSVNLKILPVPYVRFEKLRIASVTGQTGEPFVRADSFTMWLSVPALLRGVLEASQIELEKPTLTLSVDDQGIGNWTKLELKPGDLPLVPRDVALRSVEITDGTISIFNAASERVATVDGIDGEFSADGIKGPFRYKGAAAWGGANHEVKFATDVPASDGSFALKLSARTERSPDLFMLDGRVSHLSDKTSFKGVWSGKVQVPGASTVPAAGKGPPPLLDLKANVTANAQGAKFEDLALTLDNAAEPQTVTGSAVASWSSSPRLDVSLNSKWLDIDWLAGAGQGSAGFAKLKQLALGLMQSVAGDSTASAKINLEQVKIGGENAGGLVIDASRQGNVTHLKTFKVSLPGGSRLDLAGDLKNKAGKLSFLGSGFLGGSRFSRLKAWADKSGIPIDVNADGPYSAAGKLEIDDSRFFLTEASGDISGRPLAGEVKITEGEREKIDLTLQAAELDTREVFPKIASALKAKFRSALGLTTQKDGGDPNAGLPGDVRLRVIAGRLTNGDDAFRDVDVSFAVDGPRVSFPVAKLTAESGLKIGLEGRIEMRADAPAGTVAYDFVGATPDAMRDLLRKTGLLEIIGEDHLQGLSDGKIAGLIRLGARDPRSADLTFDGLLSGSRLEGRAEFDGGLVSWRSQPSRLQATLNAPSLSILLTAMGRDGREAGQHGEQTVLSVVATGTLASDALAKIDIASQSFSMRFEGRAHWPEKAALALDGTLDIKGGQGDEALAIAGLSLPDGVVGTSANGRLGIRRDNGAWTIAGENFAFGKAMLSGRVTAVSNAGATHITGNLIADRVSVPALLSVVTDAAPAALPKSAAPPAAGAAADAPAIWPEGLFDFAALRNTTAALDVSFKSLEIGGRLATGTGKMTVALQPGRLSASGIDAVAVGGKLTGSANLEKVSNGVAFTSDLRLDDAKLASINAGGQGSGDFVFHSEARAQSPAGLVAVMTGSGTAKLTGAALSGPSPSTATLVVADALSGKLQNDPRAIGDALVAAVGASTMPLGNRELAISISDGALKIGGIDFEGPGGKVEGDATADLTTLAMNASFQLTPAIPAMPNATHAKAKGPLPPAIVLYSGDLQNLAAVSVSADVGALQRELVVRQMERNVEELEQLRRADEERARLEKERRKKEAAARAAAEQKAMQEMQQLPPVIPESAGTAPQTNPVVPAQPSGRSDSDNYWTDPETNLPDAQSSNRSTLEPQPQNSTTPAGTVPNPGQNAAGQAIVIDPATGLAVAKPQPAIKPAASKSTPAKSARRRTSSDEVMKSLGGFP